MKNVWLLFSTKDCKSLRKADWISTKLIFIIQTFFKHFKVDSLPDSRAFCEKTTKLNSCKDYQTLGQIPKEPGPHVGRHLYKIPASARLVDFRDWEVLSHLGPKEPQTSLQSKQGSREATISTKTTKVSPKNPKGLKSLRSKQQATTKLTWTYSLK